VAGDGVAAVSERQWSQMLRLGPKRSDLPPSQGRVERENFLAGIEDFKWISIKGNLSRATARFLFLLSCIITNIY
jgi:hypothetical protein